tara:strand:+ start:601 stop:876 length:276 start_codon:yes stop_codon:yes gene_type:complete
MSLFGIIKNVLRSLAAYLELKNKTFFYKIVTDSRKKQKDLFNEIETLRSTGTTDSNNRADLLRNEFLDEQRHLKHLSAAYSESPEGDSDSK